MTDLKAKVDEKMAQFRAMQQELQELAAQKQQYIQQINENGMVKSELDLLEGDSKVYKLVGPVLLKQDVEDAKTNVNKRLEFIENEMEKLLKKMEKKESDAIEVRKSIMELQYKMQQVAVESARKVVETN